MKRGACALGVVMLSLWVAAPVAAQETAAGDPVAEQPAVDEVPAEAPAEEPTPPPEPTAAAAEPISVTRFEDEEAPATSVRGITVFGELLFLKPTLDDTYFAISSPTAGTFPNAPSGQRVNDEFDYEPAFRVGAGYELAESGRELELSYTRLDANASESVSGPFLWATRGSPNFTFAFGANTGGYAGTASADIDAEYQRIDAHVTQPWHLSGLDVELQFGLEWADFRVGEEYVYADTGGTGLVGTVSAASRSWGIGPEVGLGLGYEIGAPWDIPGAFSLRGGASIGLLLSETHTRAGSTLAGGSVFAVRDDESSRVLTAVHARVGVGYAIPLADRIAASVGVGYQIDTHLRGLSRVEFVDDVGRSLATTDYQDFDLQGVYASIGVVF